MLLFNLFFTNQDFNCAMSSPIQSSCQCRECVGSIGEWVPEFTQLPEADDSAQPQPDNPQHQ